MGKRREKEGGTPRTEDPELDGEIAAENHGAWVVDGRKGTLSGVEAEDRRKVAAVVQGFMQGGHAPTPLPTLTPTPRLHIDKSTCRLRATDYATCKSIGGCCRWDKCLTGNACNQKALPPSRSPTIGPTTGPTFPTDAPSPAPSAPPSPAPTPYPTSLPSLPPTAAPTSTPTSPTDTPTPAPTKPTQSPTPKATIKPYQVGWRGLVNIKKKMHEMAIGRDDPKIDAAEKVAGPTCTLPAEWQRNCEESGKCCVGKNCVVC